MLGTAVFDDLPAGHRLKEKNRCSDPKGCKSQMAWWVKKNQASPKCQGTAQYGWPCPKELRNPLQQRLQMGLQSWYWHLKSHGFVTENWTHEDIWDVSCLHDIGKWWNMLLLWRLKNHEEAIRCYTAAMNNYCPTLRSKMTYWTKSWTRRNQTNLAWSRVWIRGSKFKRWDNKLKVSDGNSAIKLKVSATGCRLQPLAPSL